MPAAPLLEVIKADDKHHVRIVNVEAIGFTLTDAEGFGPWGDSPEEALDHVIHCARLCRSQMENLITAWSNRTDRVAQLMAQSIQKTNAKFRIEIEQCEDLIAACQQKRAEFV